MPTMTQIPLDVTDDLDELAMALGAVADLLIPETDLHVVSRENLCTLITLIHRQIMNKLNWKQEVGQ